MNATSHQLIEAATATAQKYGEVWSAWSDGAGVTNEELAQFEAEAESAKAALEAHVALAEQTRDAAQEAGTKAVMDRRAVEDELRRLRASMDERCPVCGAELTLACPNCEVP